MLVRTRTHSCAGEHDAPAVVGDVRHHAADSCCRGVPDCLRPRAEVLAAVTTGGMISRPVAAGCQAAPLLVHCGAISHDRIWIAVVSGPIIVLDFGLHERNPR